MSDRYKDGEPFEMEKGCTLVDVLTAMVARELDYVRIETDSGPVDVHIIMTFKESTETVTQAIKDMLDAHAAAHQSHIPH